LTPLDLQLQVFTFRSILRCCPAVNGRQGDPALVAQTPAHLQMICKKLSSSIPEPQITDKAIASV
jgi:hypothetical protein